MSQDLNLNTKGLEKLLSNIPDDFMDILANLTKKDSNELESKNCSNNNIAGLESIMHIKNIFDKIDGHKDDKIELIKALKPFLRPSRQSKVNQCVKALRLSKFAKEALSLVNIDKRKDLL
jgi:hypothetical protein